MVTSKVNATNIFCERRRGKRGHGTSIKPINPKWTTKRSVCNYLRTRGESTKLSKNIFTQLRDHREMCPKIKKGVGITGRWLHPALGINNR